MGEKGDTLLGVEIAAMEMRVEELDGHLHVHLTQLLSHLKINQYLGINIQSGDQNMNSGAGAMKEGIRATGAEPKGHSGAKAPDRIAKAESTSVQSFRLGGSELGKAIVEVTKYWRSQEYLGEEESE